MEISNFVSFNFLIFIFNPHQKRDVGKTTLKKRLMGVSNENENENAHKLVQKDKKEEEMLFFY